MDIYGNNAPHHTALRVGSMDTILRMRVCQGATYASTTAANKGNIFHIDEELADVVDDFLKNDIVIPSKDVIIPSAPEVDESNTSSITPASTGNAQDSGPKPDTTEATIVATSIVIPTDIPSTPLISLEEVEESSVQMDATPLKEAWTQAQGKRRHSHSSVESPQKGREP